MILPNDSSPLPELSPLTHQTTIQFTPVGGRTVIRRREAPEQIKSIFIPEEYRGKYKEDWRAEVVAVSSTGGWRTGDLKPKYEDQYQHLVERPPASLTKEERTGEWWATRPYFVHKPEYPPGTRILVNYLVGIPFKAQNGFLYYLADGEHFYKAILTD